MSEMSAICKCGLQNDYMENSVRKWKPLAGAIACEQLAFVIDEAEAALMRPSVVTCQRALRRIEEMAWDALQLMPKLVSQSDMEDTVDDICAELAARAKKRKVWCPEKTLIARDFAERAKELGGGK